MVTLEVENAFNLAICSLTKKLQMMPCTRSYLLTIVGSYLEQRGPFYDIDGGLKHCLCGYPAEIRAEPAVGKYHIYSSRGKLCISLAMDGITSTLTASSCNGERIHCVKLMKEKRNPT